MLRIALATILLLIVCYGAAWAAAPKPPAGAEGYMLYLLLGFITVTITTGGQFVIAVLGHLKNGQKEEAPPMECKAEEPRPCFFGRDQHSRLNATHDALHYQDEEGTQRPVLSGHWRKQAEERAEEQTTLLRQLVAESKARTKAQDDTNEVLRGLTTALSKPPDDGS